MYLFINIGPLTLKLHGDADISYFDFFTTEDSMEPIPQFDSDTDGGKFICPNGEDQSSDNLFHRRNDNLLDDQEDLTSFSFNNI